MARLYTLLCSLMLIAAPCMAVEWLADYSKAVEKGTEKKMNLFIVFEDPKTPFQLDKRLEGALSNFVLLKLPTTHKLAKHDSFPKINGNAGIVRIDLVGKDSGNVVAELPMSEYSLRKLGQILDQPKGWLANFSLTWHTEYEKARSLADKNGTLLLISFESKDKPFQVADAYVDPLQEMTLLRLSPDYKVDGKKLLDHSALGEMLGRTGLAIIDYRKKAPEGIREMVVSVLPTQYLENEKYVAKLLTLPMGTITQRSIVWAVRVHPERPHSCDGEPSQELMNHTARHSQAQASSNSMFHANGGYGHSEIVAYAWPQNRCVIAAALDLIDSWRGSSGHWRHIVNHNAGYGYDMKHSGEKWHGTGAFLD